MAKRGEKTPSQRQLRVGEEVRHALSAILSRGGMRDPALENVPITVSEVRMSPDLRNATVFIMPLGGIEIGGIGADAIAAALTRARPFLRRQIAAAVRLKYVPELSFQADRSFDHARRIATLLDDVVPVPDDGDDDNGT